MGAASWPKLRFCAAQLAAVRHTDGDALLLGLTVPRNTEPKRPRNLPNVPWITPSGTLDPGKFPIESILRQTQSGSFEDFHSACIFLGSMVSHGRIDAGVYLLGLLRYHHDDLTRLEVVIEGLRSFREDVCVTALFDELRRVKSSNATRRYLDQVIKALASFPPDMVQAQFQSLAADTSFSYRMRAKFARAVEFMESLHV